MIDKLHSADQVGASVIRGGAVGEDAKITGQFTAECFDADGNLKWSDTFNNLVTTQGKNDLLDKYLGLAAQSGFFMGLISLTSYSTTAVTDVAAQINGTNGWKEAGAANQPTYSQSTRPAPSFSAASAGSKTTSAAVAFSITGTGTAKGCFIATSSVKDGTAGVLYSAGLFTGGDKAVGNGDTLNVTYTASV